MKNLYLLLAVIGFIVPNIFVAIESVETGNVLFWLDRLPQSMECLEIAFQQLSFLTCL
jgi:hypothetical protein